MLSLLSKNTQIAEQLHNIEIQDVTCLNTLLSLVIPHFQQDHGCNNFLVLCIFSKVRSGWRLCLWHQMKTATMKTMNTKTKTDLGKTPH